MEPAEKNLREALGLSEYETKIYVACLSFIQANISDLANTTSIPRTAVYPPLQSLVKRGLISKISKGKRIYYQAIPPQQLRHFLDQQQNQLDAAINGLAKIIASPHENFSAQYFAGINGVLNAGEQFLQQSKPRGVWYTFESLAPHIERLGESVFNQYIQKRVQKKITAKVIAVMDHDSSWSKKLTGEKELLNIISVSKKQYPLEATIATDGENIFTYTLQGVPFALVIKNKFLAQTLISIHSMIWDRYRG